MLVPKGGLDEIAHRQSLEWEPALFLLGLLLSSLLFLLRQTQRVRGPSSPTHVVGRRTLARTERHAAHGSLVLTTMCMEDGCGRQGPGDPNIPAPLSVGSLGIWWDITRGMMSHWRAKGF